MSHMLRYLLSKDNSLMDVRVVFSQLVGKALQLVNQWLRYSSSLAYKILR